MNDRDELSALEADQHSDVLRSRLPRRRVSKGVSVLLWILQIYVIAAIPLAIYAFVRALTH